MNKIASGNKPSAFKLFFHHLRNDSIIKNILKLNGWILLLLTIVLSWFSDVVQHSDWRHLVSLTGREVSFNEDGDEDLDKELQTKSSKSDVEKSYIFVFDVSSSFLNDTDISELKDACENTIKDLNDESVFKNKNNKEININKYNNPSVLEIVKSYIFKSLMELEDSSPNSNFAIWTLGSEPEILFPNEKSKIGNVKVGEDFSEAIQELNKYKRKQGDEKWTNFSKLMRKLMKTHKSEFENEYNRNGTQSTVLTIISDFNHSTESNESTRKKKEDLIEKIQVMTNASIIINMVELNENSSIEPSTDIAISPLVSDNFDWYRLKKTLILNKKNQFEIGDLLYTTKITQEEITFYYTSEKKINKSFTIFPPTGGKVTIDLPSNLKQDNPIVFPNVVIKCTKVNKVGTQLDKKATSLATGERQYETELEAEEGIRLSYEGRLPYNPLPLALRVSIDKNNMSYLIPINFEKTLPSWVKRFVVATKLGIAILFLIIFLIAIPGVRKKIGIEKNPKMNLKTASTMLDKV